MNKKNKFQHVLHTFLEINDVSFKYYLGIYLALLVLEIWYKDFFLHFLGFPLSWLGWFVLGSGILKLVFNWEKIVSWAYHSQSRPAQLFLKCLPFFQKVGLQLSQFFIKFIKKIDTIFSWSLVVYLIFLFLSEFQDVELIQKLLLFEKSPFHWILGKGMNWLLGWVIITGIISVVRKEPKKSEEQSKEVERRFSLKDWFFIFGLGILGAGLIFYKIKNLGWVAWPISIISGLLIILLSLIILSDNDEPSNYE